MTKLRRFKPGERIEIRELLHGRVWTLRPVTVVEDGPEHVVTWLAPGTVTNYPVGVRHGASCLSMWRSGEWDLAPVQWRPPGVLRIAPCGQPFEIFAPLRYGSALQWYVNFERPLQRTAQGFDTMDEILDLVVAADLSSWRRKDEDELALAVSMEVLTARDARRITDSCQRVEEALASGGAPWDFSGPPALARQLLASVSHA